MSPKIHAISPKIEQSERNSAGKLLFAIMMMITSNFCLSCQIILSKVLFLNNSTITASENIYLSSLINFTMIFAYSVISGETLFNVP